MFDIKSQSEYKFQFKLINDDQNQINNTNLEERIMNSFCSIDAMLNECVKSNEDEQWYIEFH